MRRILWFALCGILVTSRRLDTSRSISHSHVGQNSPDDMCDAALEQANEHLLNYLTMLGDQHRAAGPIWIHGLRSKKFPWTTLNNLRSMIVSLMGGCNPLQVGNSSRSDSTLWTTTDKKWVLKTIKSSEIKLLEYCDTAFSHGVVPRAWSMNLSDDWPMLKSLKPGSNFFMNEECAKKSGANWDSCIILEDPLNDMRDAVLGGTSIMVEISLVVYSHKLIVMRNFRTEVQDVAEQLGKTKADVVGKYDVKPLQVQNSVERGPFFARLADLGWSPSLDPSLRCGRIQSSDEAAAAAQGNESFKDYDAGTTAGVPVWLPQAELRGAECWTNLRDTTFREIEKANVAASKFVFIDYSVVFLLVDISGQHVPEDLQLPVSCIVSTQFAGKTLLLCLYGIDYLMDFDFWRGVESYFKGDKFKDYAHASQEMVSCAGDLSRSDRETNCRSYLELACEVHVDTRPPLGKIPQWCIDLVPAHTKIHTPDFCPLFTDTDWRSCSGKAVPLFDSSGGCQGKVGNSCQHYADQGRPCHPGDLRNIGWSPRLGRAASSLEACCCDNLADTYKTFHQTLGELGF
mmetsp:Transcript_84745/g.133864  ORF Transcript_84745/g.133864 Transcript_84745/m.133864 type:complete len:571 (-) Transcript_84745:127-1839(-)